jgi:hypothetical protein
MIRIKSDAERHSNPVAGGLMVWTQFDAAALKYAGMYLKALQDTREGSAVPSYRGILNR